MKLITSFLASAFIATPVMAGLDGAQLYAEKTCNACHGADAKKSLLPIYPKLAGQNAAYAEQQMKDIKSGVRSNGQSAAMRGVMHLVNDEEIKAIAAWLETLE